MSWLLQFCAARAAFATMFTAWSAVLPLLRDRLADGAWQAGMVQSGYHVGFLVSLFSVGFLSDRYGARRIYLVDRHRRRGQRPAVRLFSPTASFPRCCSTASPACARAGPTRRAWPSSPSACPSGAAWRWASISPPPRSVMPSAC
jgi:hypothetical protein